MITQTERTKLEEFLPWGAKRKVARQLGIQPSTVSMALNGKLKNKTGTKILQELLIVAKQHKESIAEQHNVFSALIDSF